MTLEEFKQRYPCEYFNTDWLTESDFENHINIYFKDWFDKNKFKYEEYNYSILIKDFSNFFDVWWDESKEVNFRHYYTKQYYSQHYHYSEYFCKYLAKNFDTWWNPYTYDWDFYSWALCKYLPDKFDKWWNPELFNWGASIYLCTQFADKFDKWWDSNKFIWKRASSCLCRYLPDKFDKWWDPKKLDWTDKKVLHYLILNSPIKFTTWWKKSKFTHDIIVEALLEKF